MSLPASWPPGAGEMADRIRAFDWSRTSLGPIGNWPSRLKLMVELVLANPQVSSLVCGREHLLVYNDAAARLYGARHPAALGRPLPDAFPEGWSTVAPFYARAFAGETVEIDAQPLDTRGEGEAVDVFEAALTPVRDEGGRIAFVHMVGKEIGSRLRARDALRESEAKYRTLFDTMDEGYAVVEVLRDASGRVVDVRGVEINRAYTEKSGIPASFVGRRLSEFVKLEDRWLRIYDEVSRTGVPVREENHWADADRWLSAHFSRVGNAGSNLVAIVFDDITARKRTEAALRTSEERQTYLLALSDALRPLSDPSEIQHEAMRVLGRRLGASRAQYYLADETGEYLSSSGGYTDGVPAAVGRFRLIEFGQYAYDGFHAGQTQVVCDATTDPRIGETVLRSYREVGFLAYIGVPFVQRGRLIGTVAVHQTGPRQWTDDERRLVEETAERAGIAVEQARAEQALRDSEARQSFLLKLSDALRTLADADAVKNTAARLLGEHLDVDRTFLTEVDPDGATLRVREEHLRSGASSVLGRYSFDQFGALVRRELEAGNTLAVEDVASRSDLNAKERETYAAIGIAAYLLIPLIRDGRLAAYFTLNHRTPHRWSAADIAVARQTADRTWVAVERARAEAALREVEEQQHLTLELMPALLWWADPAGDRVTGLHRWQNYTGQSEEDVQDFGWLDAIHPDDIPATRAAFEHAFATGEPLERQQRIHRNGHGYRWHLVRHVPVRDESGTIARWFGAAVDVDELRRMQDEQSVLIAELHHRTRNLIGVTGMIMRQVLASSSSLADFRTRFTERLDALSRVQSLFSRKENEPIGIGDIVRTELDALGADLASDRVRIEGETVALRKSSVQTLALAIHELATNARKYGALHIDGGSLAVRWEEYRTEAKQRRLRFEWTEIGIDAQVEETEGPMHKGGYGRKLIEEALPYTLRAKTTYTLGTDRLDCTIDMPLEP